MKLIKLFESFNPMAHNVVKPYIIAEAGVNHEGSMDIAKRLIDESKEDGGIDVSLDTQMLASLFLCLAMGLALVGMAGIGQTDPINWFNIGVLADQVMRPK